jgi:hypothetical protein
MIDKRRRTKPDLNRALAQLGVRRNEAQSSDPFGREDGAVLAVLMVAAYWPGKFADGWVTDDDFGTCSRDLPQPRPKDETRRDTIKTLVRRGLRQLKKREPLLAIERLPVGRVVKVRDPRERSTRLVGRPPERLEDWFNRFGIDRLAPDTRREFRLHGYGTLGGAEGHVLALEEAIVQRFVDAGDLDNAAKHATAALTRVHDAHGRDALTLALASVEMRKHWHGGSARAAALLKPLAERPGPFRPVDERTFFARVLLVYGMSLALKYAQEWPDDHFDTALPRQYIQRARDLMSPDNLSDRGDLSFAEAVVEELDSFALLYCSPEARHEAGMAHKTKAEVAILSALNAWRLAQRWDRIRDAVTLVLGMPRGIGLAVDEDRQRLLVPWLRAVRHYWRVVAPLDNEHLVGLHSGILDLFEALPVSVTADHLPLPQKECADLVDDCIEELLKLQKALPELPIDLSTFLAIRRTPWYQEARKRA